MAGTMSERERRELANEHRDELAEEAASPVEPRRLGQMVSLRLDPDVVSALRRVASVRGVTLSDLLREGAAMVVAANEQGMRVTEINLGVEVGSSRLSRYESSSNYTGIQTEIGTFRVTAA